MKRIWITAAVVGFTALAAWVTWAIATTPPPVDPEAVYWACMEQYGFSPDQPATSGIDLERLGEADRACSD